MLENMRWDLWELFGLVGEGLFFARMAVQWLASEKERKPVIPVVYWYLSLAGAAILVFYALHLGSFVILIPQIVGLVFYARGIQLEYGARRRTTGRERPEMNGPGLPWPKISAVVPIHNEEARLAAVLEDLAAQTYPGPTPEIIAALNSCTDDSRRVAEQFPVRIVEDARAGMSFGKNLGARMATGDMLVFIDADTRLPGNAFRRIAESGMGKTRYAGTVAGAPDRGGMVVRVCFRLANIATRRKQAHAPGGVVFMDRETFVQIGGFNEKLPQGTSTDCIWRALAAGAEYVHIDSFRAVTSIRRFEKTGIIRQMLSWRGQHRSLASGRREDVEKTVYENIR